MQQNKRKTTTIHGLFFKYVDMFMLNLYKFLSNVLGYNKHFFYNQESVFEILFTSLYFIEQFGLFVFLIIFPKTDIIIVIGVFVLILLTTKAFEKICMQSRYKRLSDEVVTLTTALDIQEKNLKEINNQYLKEYNQLSENHNILVKDYDFLLKKFKKGEKRTKKTKAL